MIFLYIFCTLIYNINNYIVHCTNTWIKKCGRRTIFNRVRVWPI